MFGVLVFSVIVVCCVSFLFRFIRGCVLRVIFLVLFLAWCPLVVVFCVLFVV